MAGIAQRNLALIIHDRGPGPHTVTKLCLGKDHIQLHQHLIVQIDSFPVARRLGGQFGQDPLNFLFLLDLQFPQGVVGIDGRHGFNEEGRACGGHIVHKTRHFVLKLALDRHHIAALANGDDGLAQVLGIGRRRNDFLQAVPDLAGLDAHVAANIRKSRRCIIRDLLFRQNCAENLIFQVFIGGQCAEHRV